MNTFRFDQTLSHPVCTFSGKGRKQHNGNLEYVVELSQLSVFTSPTANTSLNYSEQRTQRFVCYLLRPFKRKMVNWLKRRVLQSTEEERAATIAGGFKSQVEQNRV